MAKRKKQDEGGTAVADPPVAQAVATVAEATPAMTPAEIEAIRKELAEAKRRLKALEKRNRRIIDAEREVESWKRGLDSLQERINETRKAWKDAVEKLQGEIKRQEAQNELPFHASAGGPAVVATEAPTPAPTAAAVDTTGSTQLATLVGLSESLLAKLTGVDVSTVAELEAYMDAGKLVPGRVKGLGQAAIDKITDALLAFRQAHPKGGEVDSRPKVCREKDCGTQYAGELANCPACNGTLHERVEPEATPAAVTETEAAKPEVAGDPPSATDEGTEAPTPAASPAPEAGTVFDGATSGEAA